MHHADRRQVSGSRIDLRRTDRADNEADYRVARSSDGGATWQEIATLGANVTGYSATNLQPGTAYRFQVRARHANNTYSAYTNAVIATTVPLAAPTSLTTVVRDGSR